MLFAHMIEDILKLYLGNCRHIKANGYDRYSEAEISTLSHEKRINELKFVHEEADREFMEGVISDLHGLRKIRNLLMHDFTIQVGNSLRTEEGKDQITAMLNSIFDQEASMLYFLQRQNQSLIESTSSIRFIDANRHESESGLKSVESSEVQRILSDLEGFADR